LQDVGLFEQEKISILFLKMLKY